MIHMSKKEIDKKKLKDTAEEVKETAEKAADAAETAVKKTRNFKKLKYGSMFYVTILLVTAIVVVLNVMVGIFSKRSPMKLDITPDNRYELSEQSIEAVKALDKDVDIVVTNTRDYFEAVGNQYENYYAQYYGVPSEVPYEMIPELLDKYAIYAEQGKGSISVKYVDMDKDPDIINKYKKYYNGDIQSGNIIVASGDRVRVLGGDEVMNMLSADQTAMQSQQLKFVFTGESVLTSAITSVTDSHPVKVAFVKTMNGAAIYNEDSYGPTVSAFEQELLQKNGYDCTDVDISMDEISPDEYDMLVLLAPSVDFTEDIINKLSDFLYNGGQYNRNMVYAPDIAVTDLPNIAEFLADWSIKVEDSIILDDENAIMTNYRIMLNVGDSEAVGTLPSDKLPIVAEYARELSQITKNNEDIVKEVLKSYDTSYTADLTDKNSSLGESGARTAAILSQKQHSEQFEVYTSSLLVLGTPTMAGSTYLQQNTTFNNASVLLNIINNMTGKESGVVIPDKNLQTSFITATAKQARNIRVIVIWIVPFIIAAVGVFVLLRRRNK